MWGIVIFSLILAVIFIIVSVVGFKFARDTELDEITRKNNKRLATFYLLLASCAIIFNIFYGIPQAINFEPVHVTNSNQKEKCSMCGKKVSKDDMRGKWCKDCQNDAFGKDGWYYDINHAFGTLQS